MDAFVVALLVVGVLIAAGGIVVLLTGRRSAPAAQTTDRSDWAHFETGAGTRSGPAMIVGALLAGLGVVLTAVGGVMLVTTADDGRAAPGQTVVAGGDQAGDANAGSLTATSAESTPEPTEDTRGSATPSSGTEQATTETVTVQPSRTSRQETGTRPSGDLGLATPMTRPSCDGRGIVVLYSAVTPGAYESEIRTALANHPGSRYLRTDQACPSLRPRDDNGNVIYAVYRESGYSQSEVCADVAVAPSGSYGRWLDTTSDPSVLVRC